MKMTHKLDKHMIVDKKKLMLYRHGLMYGFVFSAFFVKFIIGALFNDGIQILDFNVVSEMYAESILIPFMAILNLIIAKRLYNRLTIEYNMSFKELSEYYYDKHIERQLDSLQL